MGGEAEENFAISLLKVFEFGHLRRAQARSAESESEENFAILEAQVVDFEEWRDAGMRRGGEEPWMEMESRPAAVDGDGEASRATPMGDEDGPRDTQHMHH